MAETNVLEALEEETVQVTIPANQTCDKCGSTVRASHTADKDNTYLYFCGHHIRNFAETLKKQGFRITPEDISYDSVSNSMYNSPTQE